MKAFRKSDNLLWLATVCAALLYVASAHASANLTDETENSAPSLIDQLSQNISKQYPGAKVTVDSQLHWTRGTAGDGAGVVALLGETSRGEMMFTVTDSQGHRSGEGWVTFAAWQPARVAARRVHPGDRLSADAFTLQNVNVAAGQAHQLRGVILDPETSVANLEARQSVLEGEMLLSTSVQRVPDLRRGDAVTVHVVSNELSLSTQGIAEEPAYAGSSVRVTASKTKRELVGKLLSNGIVEVKL